MTTEFNLNQSAKIINLDENLFDGYLSEIEDGIWLSAIKSKHQGNGDFSKLIKQLKEEYNWIKIPTPSNQMIEVAEHLGFIKKEEYFGEPFNEIGIIMFWEKEILNFLGEKDEKI